MQQEIDSFLDWTRSVGKRYKDWDAALKTMLRRRARETGRAAPVNGTASSPEGLDSEEYHQRLRNWLHVHPLRTPPELDEFLGKPEWHDKVQPYVEARDREARAAVLREMGVSDG